MSENGHQVTVVSRLIHKIETNKVIRKQPGILSNVTFGHSFKNSQFFEEYYSCCISQPTWAYQSLHTVIIPTLLHYISAYTTGWILLI